MNKTILSDLQEVWNVFRQAVVDNVGFQGWEKVLFHTDEAISWETVRDLKLMPPLVLIIHNLCFQGSTPEEVLLFMNMIHKIFEESLEEYPM